MRQMAYMVAAHDICHVERVTAVMLVYVIHQMKPGRMLATSNNRLQNRHIDAAVTMYITNAVVPTGPGQGNPVQIVKVHDVGNIVVTGRLAYITARDFALALVKPVN